jgi:hypothetical protein
MNILLLRKRVLWLSLILSAFLFSPRLRPQETIEKPTVVQIDKSARGTDYRVDSELTGSKPTDDLLHALNQVADRYGVNHRVVVFIDPRLPISEIWNVNGVAAKAQLTNIHFFVYFRENQMTTELKWMPFIPFSKNPPVK